mmetsp:Transcript_40843/g.95416  ORF Transcript_40843/g.95416 Transcript_40843/m.95416 type:complete len:212 (-) Transcript_40843:219-854(-)
MTHTGGVLRTPVSILCPQRPVSRSVDPGGRGGDSVSRFTRRGGVQEEEGFQRLLQPASGPPAADATVVAQVRDTPRGGQRGEPSASLRPEFVPLHVPRALPKRKMDFMQNRRRAQPLPAHTSEQLARWSGIAPLERETRLPWPARPPKMRLTSYQKGGFSKYTMNAPPSSGSPPPQPLPTPPPFPASSCSCPPCPCPASCRQSPPSLYSGS